MSWLLSDFRNLCLFACFLRVPFHGSVFSSVWFDSVWGFFFSRHVKMSNYCCPAWKKSEKNFEFFWKTRKFLRKKVRPKYRYFACFCGPWWSVRHRVRGGRGEYWSTNQCTLSLGSRSTFLTWPKTSRPGSTRVPGSSGLWKHRFWRDRKSSGLNLVPDDKIRFEIRKLSRHKAFLGCAKSV